MAPKLVPELNADRRIRRECRHVTSWERERKFDSVVTNDRRRLRVTRSAETVGYIPASPAF